PAGPPELDGSIGTAGPYIVIGTGTVTNGSFTPVAAQVTLASLLNLSGAFYFQISTTEVQLAISASADLLSLGNITASGDLVMAIGGGVYGSLAISGSISLGGVVDFDGQFQLDFNTTSSSQTIQTIQIDPSTGAVTGVTNSTITALTIEV